VLFVYILKNDSSTIILFVGIDILCVTYYLVSITISDPQTTNERYASVTVNDVSGQRFL